MRMKMSCRNSSRVRTGWACSRPSSTPPWRSRPRVRCSSDQRTNFMTTVQKKLDHLTLSNRKSIKWSSFLNNCHQKTYGNIETCSWTPIKRWDIGPEMIWISFVKEFPQTFGNPAIINFLTQKHPSPH